MADYTGLPGSFLFGVSSTTGARITLKLTDNGDGTGSLTFSGTVSASYPYSEASDGQPATTGSAVALVGFNGSTVDRLRVANAGTQIANATPGVLVVQGTGTAGSVPISGSISSSPVVSSTAAQTDVSVSAAASTVLLAANASRKAAVIMNANTGALLVNFGAAASQTAFVVVIEPGGPPLMIPGALGILFTGSINAIFATGAATAFVNVTELT